MAADFLADGPTSADRRLLLAHGAGAPMDSPFLERMARGLAERGLRVLRFEFPYMAARRGPQGRRPGPDPMPRLEASFRQALAEAVAAEGIPASRWIIGGKSLGGRVASRVADASGVAGLVCLGYPFHPPGRPDATRTAHLLDLRTPTLVLQGERDPFGAPDEIAGYGLSPAIRIVYLADGDHSFEPRRASGRSLEQNEKAAVDEIAAFVANPRRNDRR